MRASLPLLLALLSTTTAAAETLTIDNRHSTIAFTIGIAGGLGEVDGSFTKYEGTVDYDPEDPSRSAVSITIDAASISTGHPGRDEHLRDTDFFDVKKHPRIAFRSERVERDGKTFVLTGPLTMHGVTRTVRIPFRRTHEAPLVTIFGTPTAIFEGTVTLARKDFGIQANDRWNSVVEATGEIAMANDVDVRLRIIAQRPRAK